MKSEKEQLFEALLDLHLDRLEGDERESLEAACRDDAELAATCDRVGEILQPLDQWGTASPPPHLADRVLSHIGDRTDAALTASRPAEPASRLVKPAGRTRWPFISLREPLAVAACIALLLGVFYPGVSALRRNSRKALCSDNLRSIYSGTTMYRASFGGALPYAGRVPGSSWLPTAKPVSPVGDGRQTFASNSRHIYLLVKMDFGPKPRDFVCPGGSNGRPMDSTQLARCKDFDQACNISYASMNLSGAAPSLRPVRALAYLGDASPLFVDARFDPSVDPDHTNSRAHGGKGQMILTLDGTVRWMTTPVYGTQKDNVWLAGDIRHYTGHESPIGSDDVQLVPGYPATDRAYSRKRVAH